MARPTRYEVSGLLDAALGLAAHGGPAAVTMQAVAKSTGASNGSVYHRFATRGGLLAELWLGTVEEFQDSVLGLLTDESARPVDRAVAAARQVVAFSRAHPERARVLLYGPHDFGRDDWPAQYGERAARGERRVREALDGLCRALGATRRQEREQVLLAVVDLPLSVVRRGLRVGGGLPAGAEELVARSAGLLVVDVADVERTDEVDRKDP